MGQRQPGGNRPGETAYFIAGGDWSSNSPNGLFTIYADAGGSNIYFGGVGAGTAQTYASAPISWTSNAFHQIGVEWTTSDCEIYLDGALAATGDGVSYVPTHGTWTNGFFIGSDNTGYEQARGAFWAMLTWMEEYGGLLYQRLALRCPTPLPPGKPLWAAGALAG